MIPILHSKLDNIKITKASLVETTPSQLEIEAVAMISGELSPCYCPITGEALRDPDTNNLTLLEYTPELINAYASNFSAEEPINFNIDHTDNSFAGQITNLSTKEIDGKLALIAKGIVENKEWVDKILGNSFSGISIETNSNLSDPSKSKLTAISLLNSLPPACSKDKCRTKILTASSAGDISMPVDNSDLIFTDDEQDYLDDLGLNTKASWDGPSSEKGLLDYARDKNGKIIVSKIRKYFLIVESPSGQDGNYDRVDFKYPVGSIINGKPDYVLDGCIAALKRSAGEGMDLKQKIRRIIIKRFGSDKLPPSLKTKATMQLLEADGDIMVEKDKKTEVKTEASKEEVPVEDKKTEVKTEASKEEVPVEDKKTEVKTEASKEEVPVEDKKTEVKTEASEKVPEVKIPEITPKVVFTKAQLDEVAIEMGAPSFDAAVGMIKELSTARTQVKELSEFKEKMEEQEIMNSLPKGIWAGEIEVNGVMTPKIKVVAQEIRSGGVGVMLKYAKSAASANVIDGKASEVEISEHKEIKTKGSSEATEIEPEGASKKAAEIQAVKDFQSRYMKS